MPAITYMCLDCAKLEPPGDLWPDDTYYCQHWRPEFWEAKGYKRDWGEGAVMNWPKFEMLRRESEGKITYVILAPTTLSQPLLIKTNDPQSWASYYASIPPTRDTQQQG
jgi:hypothetical protein